MIRWYSHLLILFVVIWIASCGFKGDLYLPEESEEEYQIGESKMKKNIILYINPNCPYCTRAIELLKKKGQEITLINVVDNPEKKQEMIEKSNRTTTPQIFIDGKHIGGCDDLYALDAKGELDPLLK